MSIICMVVKFEVVYHLDITGVNCSSEKIVIEKVFDIYLKDLFKTHFWKLIKTNNVIGEIPRQNSNCSKFYALMLQHIFSVVFI